MTVHRGYSIRCLRKALSLILLGMLISIPLLAPAPVNAGGQFGKYEPKRNIPTVKSHPEPNNSVELRKTCSDAKKNEVLAPATVTNQEVKLDCSMSLGNSNHVITKRINIVDSGVYLDCGGSTIAPKWYNDSYAELNIYTQKTSGEFHRPSDVTIKNCTIYGRVSIYQEIHGTDSSQLPGHTQRIQDSAPSNITLDNLTIIGSGLSGDGAMVYFYPGVTHSKLINSEIRGDAPSPNGGGIYLGAETAHLTIKNNYIHAKTHHREQMSIDGSAHNRIVGNKFSALNHGGLYIYRNCGERGQVRHQWPKQNQIINNIFYYDKYDGEKPTIWLGSRNQKRIDNDYEDCHLDDNIPFGSGANNEDLARYNAIGYNQIVKLMYHKMIWQDDGPNYRYGNKTTNYPKKTKSGCFLHLERPIFFKHDESVGLKYSLDQGQKYTCNDNEVAMENLPLEKKTFQCGVSGNNSGTMCEVNCPADKKVVGIRAGCNLEFNDPSGSWLSRIIQSIPWDQLKVFRASDNVNQGYCSISKIDADYKNSFTGSEIQKTVVGIRKGMASLKKLLGTHNSIQASCSERDQDGGDCVIMGEILCL